MREILISTESGSDLPQDLIEKYGFYVRPMHVQMGNETYEDGTIPVDMVYEYYEKTGKVPTTSAVNVNEYLDFFAQLKAEHPGCIIYHLAYSSVASSTYQNAAVAVKETDDVFLIDTKNVSGGCTAHLVETWKLIQKRKDTVTDYKALADEIQALSDKIECHFIPGTLEYLRAGGRVSNAAYLGATILRLKPLIEIDREGHLIATKKYRGSMAKIVDKFMDEFLKRYELSKDCLYLMYSKGLSSQVLNRMKEKALEMGFKTYEYVMTGCVISCHGGKGAIGLAGVKA